jgi:hypothetical protein
MEYNTSKVQSIIAAYDHAVSTNHNWNDAEQVFCMMTEGFLANPESKFELLSRALGFWTTDPDEVDLDFFW